jgi:hypothetical protein
VQLHTEEEITISRVHERTISFRFLGIILRVLRLEVSVWMDFLNHREEELYVFLSGFPPFSFYSIQQLTSRNCKRLRDFEEIEIEGKAVEVTVNSKVKKL